MSAGPQLRRAREADGISIRELASRAEVAPSTVWRIETGRLDPTVGMLEQLMAAIRPEPARPATPEAAVSLVLGRLAAAELLRDPDRVLSKARNRVRSMLSNPDLPRGSRRWLAAWQLLLESPLEEVVAALIDPTERGYELRQNTPFTGLVSNEDRLAAVDRVRREHLAARSA